MKIIRTALLCLLAMWLFHSYAQDVITLKNGEEIKAKVEEISLTEIKYKRFDNLDGPAMVIEKTKVFFINYENGTREVIESLDEKSAQKKASDIETIGNTSENDDYALLHIYRRSAVGALLNYDLYLDDKIICRVRNKWKETIKIDKEGLITLWARTEAKKELPIDIQFGEEYYIRCSVSMGFAAGRPKLELVDKKTGEAESESISEKE